MESDINKKKLLLAGIVLLFVILFIIGHNIFTSKDKLKKSNNYLILGNYLIFQKTNTDYMQINKLSDDILKYKYKITDGTNVKDNIKMQFLNNRWYFFNDEYDEIDMPNFRCASYNWDIDLANYQKEIINNPNEDPYISEFFSDNEIEDIETYKNAYVVSFDFDNDGNKESIYTFNNYALEVTEYSQDGYMFVVKDGNIIYHTNLEETDAYTVMEIIDLDSDNNYEIIVNKGSKDLKTFNSKYQVYTFNNNKFNLVR